MKETLDQMTNMPSNANGERILVYGHDTIVFKAVDGENYAIIEDRPLFDKTETKNKVLKTNDFPLQAGRVAKIIGLRADHNIKFAERRDILAFEQFAQITVNIEDKDYSNIPLFDLLPYNRVDSGSYTSYQDLLNKVTQLSTDPGTPATGQLWYNTTTGLLKYNSAGGVVVIPQETAEQFNVLALDTKFKQLGRPIDPPHDGKIDLGFKSALKDKRTDDITVYGQKFGGNIVEGNPPVMYVKISWVGELIRTAR